MTNNQQTTANDQLPMKNSPYIGPRPFERSDRDRFFGRARETRDLLSLIMAERVVLFYAQSGAGKTSLLNTQIVPALEGEGFNVLPIARVGSDAPRGVEAVSINNMFVFSALLALAGPQGDISQLSAQTLPGFLASIVDDEHPPIIILDQFEEILTTHRDRWEEARGFFEQLREALRAIPRLGVVLAMREDHVAGLDPYSALLPRRLRTRFRMELLGYDGALEAVKRPAQNAGCAYGTGVAERLVDDLRRIQVTTSSAGSPNGALGPYIEPVQLQVVCSRLWDNLPEREERIITWPEIEQFGNIDRALTDFYESALQYTTKETGVPERQLRRWFATDLITPMKTRGLALRGERDTNGLSNEAVDVLDRQHIIRAEARAGAYWYELAHDRLVEPIVNSNAAWEQARMTSLRITAQKWQQTKNADLLYSGSVLVDAMRFTRTHPDDVEDYEREFLEASTQAQRVKARNRIMRLTVIAALSVGTIIMAALAVLAFQSKQEADQQRAVAYEAKTTAEANRVAAEEQSRLARAGQLAAQAQALDTAFSARRLLLAVEALKALQPNDPPSSSIANTLRQVLGDKAGTALNVNNDLVVTAAFRPDSRELATGNDQGSVRLWDVSAGKVDPQPIVLSSGYKDPLTAVVYSPDAKLLAAGNTAGQIVLWKLPVATPLTVLPGTAPIYAMTISPDGSTLFAARLDGSVSGWSLADSSAFEEIVRLLGHDDQVTAVAVSPDARLVVTGSADNAVAVWDSSTGQMLARLQHDDEINAVTFSPDGHWLAAGTTGGAVWLWRNLFLSAEQAGEPIELEGNGSAVEAVEFSLADVKWLSAQTSKGTTLIWNMDDLAAAPMEEGSQGDGLLLKLTSPDRQWLMTVASGKAALWLLDPNELARRACEVAGRNLTRTEWSWYLGDQPYRKTCDQWPVEDSGQ